jgi:hypothetical protein
VRSALLNRTLVNLLVTASAVVLLGLASQVASAGATGLSATPSTTEPYLLCPRPSTAHAACLAVLEPVVRPAYSGSGVGGGYAPSDLRSAYGLTTEAEAGQTVAIVDAYDDPSAESDLAIYRSHYGLPECSAANGCFRKINQAGGSTPPEGEYKWGGEISLDLDMVSATCRACHILLVEANTNSYANLSTAENEAVSQGATAISNSWGGEQFSGETSFNTYYNHPGIPIAFASGDHGEEVEYPAASPTVIAVGGTSLTPSSGGRGWKETAWSGTGSGCSSYEVKPTWQFDTGCSDRTNNDVSAVADPNTPVSVYDSDNEPGWMLFGGTSVATPIIAGTIALANPYTRSLGADAFYKEAIEGGTNTLDDVTEGSNGSCGNYLCTAQVGFDGPTGLGSPYGAPIATPPPEVITDPASEVEVTQATLKGRVNPNGLATTYYFQYGETTSYGSSTTEEHAGTGKSLVSEHATITNMVPGTTYHDRLVATSVAGTSYGADEEVTPTADEPSSRWTARAPSNEANSSIWAMYRGSNEHLSETYYLSGSWLSQDLTSPVRAGTTPAVVRVHTTNPNGAIWAFYNNTSGDLAETYYTGSAWTTKDLGVQMASGTSPTVVRVPDGNANAAIWVFYETPSGHLAETYYLGSGEWITKDLGVSMASETSPTAVRSPATNTNASIWVLYQGSNGHLTETYYLGSGEWITKDLGVSIGSGTSPAVMRSPTTNASGSIWAFYQASNGHLAETYYLGSGEWITKDLGVSMGSGTSPSVVRTPTTNANGASWVLYQGSNGHLTETYYLGSGEWITKDLGVSMASGTSPSVVRTPTTNANGAIWAFYKGSNGDLSEEYDTGSGWLNKDLGAAMG